MAKTKMPTEKENPLIEILAVVAMVALNEYVLTRWLTPLISAFTSGVVVGLALTLLYSWNNRPRYKRVLLVVLVTGFFVYVTEMLFK
jgi:hypothetical protein